MESIIVALITGGFSLIGVVVTCLASGKKTSKEVTHKLELHQAVTDTKIDELTREVRQHNGFAEKIPLLQAESTDLKRRVSNLEKYHMQQN